MFTLIDNLLNKVTMYRVVLYVLTMLFAAALVLAMFGALPIDPAMLVFSLLFITILCWAANTVFSAAFDAPTNVESVYISAFILVLLITPPTSVGDGTYLEMACWASLWTMASKYIFAIRRKHLFNPVAFAVALTAITLNQSASWWVGTQPMVPFVLVGGFLITRKIQRFDLVLSFLVVSLLGVAAGHLSDPASAGTSMMAVLLRTHLLFFATVMLTEPLTTPPSRALRLVYGALVGLLATNWVQIGSFSFSPELALVAGNLFSYLVSPKEKLMLTLRRKVQSAADVFDFWFSSDRSLRFQPGQYLEWTLAHSPSDSRGNRRYLTIASSPTEKEIAIGVKFYEPSSTFKKRLHELQPGDSIVASQLAGEFLLPRDKTKKLAFVAGGIGITPFRSMVRSLIDTNDTRSVVLLYSNRTVADVAYKDLFDEAQQKIGLKTVYAITDQATAPAGWQGRMGRIDAQAIREEIPDFAERYFYLSGTHAMVVTFQKTLRSLGVPRSHIKQDFFPGFA